VVNNKNVFYSTENLLTPIVQTISNVVGDCRGSVAVASSSSSSQSQLTSSSSSVANSTVAVSSSETQKNSGGGVITITTQNATATNTAITNNQNTNPSNAQNTSVVATNQTGAFKSKIKITDPYVCGQGAYGSVTDPKANGVDYVYYEFYKDGSNISSYNYKLKMSESGDFFLPISKTSNLIAEGNYKVVFYAYDKDGNKAQGEYTAQIANDCTNAKVNGVGSPTVRSGGLEIMQFLVLMISIMATYICYKLSKTTDIKLKI
jgi:hypothetical protein